MLVLLPLLICVRAPSHGPAFQQKSLYQQVVEKPDPNNGYEDYLRAADMVNDGCGDVFYFWKPGPPKEEDPDTAPDLAQKRKAIANSLAGVDYLDVENQMMQRYGRALDLVRAGNEKRSWHPKATPSEKVVEYYAFRTLAQCLGAEAYTKFSNGNSAQGVKSLLDGFTFASKIQMGSKMNWLLGLAYDEIYFTGFDRFLGSLSQKDTRKIVAYTDDWLAQPNSYVTLLKQTQEWNAGRMAGILDQYRERYNSGNQRPSNVQEFIGKMSPDQLREAKSKIADGIRLRTQELLQRFDGPESQWYSKRPWERRPETPFTSLDEFTTYMADLFAPSDWSLSMLQDRTEMRLLGLHARIIDYRWKFGKLPDKLADAVPANLLKDPVNDGAFAYESRGDGKYKLYSKGVADLGLIELRPNSTGSIPSAIPPLPDLEQGCSSELLAELSAEPIGRPASGQKKSLYRQIVSMPDPNNGYEDYIHGADLLMGVNADLYFNWTPKQLDEQLAMKRDVLSRAKEPPPADPREEDPRPTWSPEQEARLQLATALHEGDLLSAQRLITQRCGRGIDYVSTGNQKRCWDPREKLDFLSLYPELAHFKDLARLHRADAYVHFADGDTSTGTRDILNGYEFSRRIASGTLIGELVAIACESITLLSVQENLDHLSATDTADVIRYTDYALSGPSSYLKSIQVERSAALSSIDVILTSPLEVFGTGAAGEEGDPIGSFIRKLSNSERQTLKASLSRQINDAYDKIATHFDQDESTWADPIEGIATSTPSSIKTMQDAVDAILDMLLPSTEAATQSVLRSRAQLRLLGLHARILSFRWHNNRWPATLSEVANPKLCFDPLSKAPFQYELTDTGYKLYSKGNASTGPVELKYKRPKNLGDDGTGIPPR